MASRVGRVSVRRPARVIPASCGRFYIYLSIKIEKCPISSGGEASIYLSHLMITRLLAWLCLRWVKRRLWMRW